MSLRVAFVGRRRGTERARAFEEELGHGITHRSRRLAVDAAILEILAKMHGDEMLGTRRRGQLDVAE